MKDQGELFPEGDDRKPWQRSELERRVDDDLGELFDYAPNRVRRNDYPTSKAGATSIGFRAGSQKARLLEVYRQHPEGLTDEEAAAKAGLPVRSCYWKRCNELREGGYIHPTGAERPGVAGVPRIVCAVQA